MRAFARSLIWACSLALVFILPTLMGQAAEPQKAPAKADPPAKAEIVGADTCTACHDGVLQGQKKEWHSRLIAGRPGSANCEDCHGPGSLHAADPVKTRTLYDVTHAKARTSAQACLSCHENKISIARWRTSPHAKGDVRCWNCHSQKASPHTLLTRKPDERVCYSCHREQEPLFNLTSHHPVREGRMTCYDCHDPHGRQTNRDYVKRCVSCHVDKRGPYIFEHGAISGELTDACLDCHRPHGSPNDRLLKFVGRGLCLQCHADKARHFAPATCWTSGCHTGWHGSNSSPLLLGP